nr:hypothetical protein [Tanacetum cinerariifolium]
PIITPTIPPSPDYTPVSPDYSHASDTESDPSSGHIPPLPAVSPFLSLDDDTTDNYFYLDDSDRDSSSDSSSEASSDFHSDASFDSSSRHSLSDHSSPDLPSTFAGPSRKRRRDSGYLADVEVGLRETSLRDDVIARGSDEHHLEHDIDLEIQAEIHECFAYKDALRDRGTNARVVVEARVERITPPAMPKDIPEPAQEEAVEVMYETLRDLVQRFYDHTEAITVHRVQVIEGVQRERGHRIVEVESEVTALTERVDELERDNRRLRGTASVESQRVD